jgi:hypothetical protein
MGSKVVSAEFVWSCFRLGMKAKASDGVSPNNHLDQYEVTAPRSKRSLWPSLINAMFEEFWGHLTDNAHPHSEKRQRFGGDEVAAGF